MMRGNVEKLLSSKGRDVLRETKKPSKSSSSVKGEFPLWIGQGVGRRPWKKGAISAEQGAKQGTPKESIE